MHIYIYIYIYIQRVGLPPGVAGAAGQLLALLRRRERLVEVLAEGVRVRDHDQGDLLLVPLLLVGEELAPLLGSLKAVLVLAAKQQDAGEDHGRHGLVVDVTVLLEEGRGLLGAGEALLEVLLVAVDLGHREQRHALPELVAQLLAALQRLRGGLHGLPVVVVLNYVIVEYKL